MPKRCSVKIARYPIKSKAEDVAETNNFMNVVELPQTNPTRRVVRGGGGG